MSTKDFKSIDEQLELLRSRGLIIDDENIAKDFLLYNNYYRISGYSLTLRKNNIFSKSEFMCNSINSGLFVLIMFCLKQITKGCFIRYLQ